MVEGGPGSRHLQAEWVGQQRLASTMESAGAFATPLAAVAVAPAAAGVVWRYLLFVFVANVVTLGLTGPREPWTRGFSARNMGTARFEEALSRPSRSSP